MKTMNSRHDKGRIYVVSLLVLLLTTFCVLPLFSTNSWAKDDTALLSVSLPSFNIGPEETIVGLRVNLRAAAIVHIAQIRSCWDLHILNGDALKSELEAQALFLSAGIRERGLSYFEDFITIFKNEPEEFPHSFDIDIQLTVTDAGWNKIRYIRFKKDRIVLSPKE